MLKHIGKSDAAMRIEKALADTLKDQNNRTVDLGGNLGTEQFTHEIIKNMI